MDFDEEKIIINPLTVIEDGKVSPEAEYFIEQSIQFQQLMMMYNCAIREIRTKLDILNDDLALRNHHSPIESITHRVKKPLSIVDKLERKGYNFSVPAIMANLNDVAGIRVICSFIDDIYSVAAMLAKQDDIKVVKITDYIKNPKPNGYRSYHMIVEVPVFFSDYKKPMRVEVQLRTIAMDFWASLEHQLKYKKEIADTANITERLTACAETIAAIDAEMQNIRKDIEAHGGGNDDDHLYNKVEQLSNSFLNPNL